MKTLLFSFLLVFSTLSFAQEEQEPEIEIDEQESLSIEIQVPIKAQLGIELPRSIVSVPYRKETKDRTISQITNTSGNAKVTIKVLADAGPFGEMEVVNESQELALNKDQAAQVGLQPDSISFKFKSDKKKNYLVVSAMGGLIEQELEVQFDKGNVKKANKGKVFKAHLTAEAQQQLNEILLGLAGMGMMMGQSDLSQLGEQYGVDISEIEDLSLKQINQNDQIIVTDKSIEIPASKIEVKAKGSSTISL